MHRISGKKGNGVNLIEKVSRLLEAMELVYCIKQ